jgi:NAD/NADP transhydrogenase beta subunit
VCHNCATEDYRISELPANFRASKAPHEELIEMEDINERFAGTDVALVVAGSAMGNC